MEQTIRQVICLGSRRSLAWLEINIYLPSRYRSEAILSCVVDTINALSTPRTISTKTSLATALSLGRSALASTVRAV